MRRKKPSDALDFVAAGEVLKNEILPRFASLGTFAKYKNLSDTTLRQIVAGRYNEDVGASPTILFKNCLEITGDVEQAQFLVARYLSALGVIPEDRNLPILQRITRIEDELRAVKAILLRKARKVPREPVA